MRRLLIAGCFLLAACDSVTDTVTSVIGDEPLTAESASVRVVPDRVILDRLRDSPVQFTAQLLDGKGRVVQDAPGAKWELERGPCAGCIFGWIDSISGLAHNGWSYGAATVTATFELPNGSVSGSAAMELPPPSEMSIGPSRTITFDEDSSTSSFTISAKDRLGRAIPVDQLWHSRIWFGMRDLRGRCSAWAWGEANADTCRNDDSMRDQHGGKMPCRDRLYRGSQAGGIERVGDL